MQPEHIFSLTAMQEVLDRLAAVEQERDHFQTEWAKTLREKHEIRDAAVDKVRLLREALIEIAEHLYDRQDYSRVREMARAALAATEPMSGGKSDKQLQTDSAQEVMPAPGERTLLERKFETLLTAVRSMRTMAHGRYKSTGDAGAHYQLTRCEEALRDVGEPVKAAKEKHE